MLPEVPYLSKDLIEMLDQKYPDRCPNPKDTDREIWMKAGERRLVNELLISLKREDPKKGDSAYGIQPDGSSAVG